MLCEVDNIIKPSFNNLTMLQSNIGLYILTCKTNKLRNIYPIGSGARNITIKKWKISYFKIKIIDGNMPGVMVKSKSKKGASVSKELTLFN